MGVKPDKEVIPFQINTNKCNDASKDTDFSSNILYGGSMDDEYKSDENNTNYIDSSDSTSQDSDEEESDETSVLELDNLKMKKKLRSILKLEASRKEISEQSFHICLHKSCHKHFDSFKLLLEHAQLIHKKDIYRCSSIGCNTSYLNSRDFYQHNIWHKKVRQMKIPE